MNQLTLSNIETKVCPRCKRGLKCESIINDEVTYFCPLCLKEYKFTVCLNCGILFEADDYKLCPQCNTQGIKRIINARRNNQEERPAEAYIVKQTPSR